MVFCFIVSSTLGWVKGGVVAGAEVKIPGLRIFSDL